MCEGQNIISRHLLLYLVFVVVSYSYLVVCEVLWLNPFEMIACSFLWFPGAGVPDGGIWIHIEWAREHDPPASERGRLSAVLLLQTHLLPAVGGQGHTDGGGTLSTGRATKGETDTYTREKTVPRQRNVSPTFAIDIYPMYLYLSWCRYVYR